MQRMVVAVVSAMFLIGTVASVPPSAYAGAQMYVTVVMHKARTEEIVWGIANRIKESLEKNTNGEMAVRLLGPEVGGERDLMEGTSRNEFQIFQSGDMGVSTYGAKCAVTTVPFVFPGYEGVDTCARDSRADREMAD